MNFVFLHVWGNHTLGKQHCSAEINEVTEDRLEGCSDPAWKAQTLHRMRWWLDMDQVQKGHPISCSQWPFLGRVPRADPAALLWQRRPPDLGADGPCPSLPESGCGIRLLSIRLLIPQVAHKWHELCFASTLPLLRPYWWNSRGDGWQDVVWDVLICQMYWYEHFKIHKSNEQSNHWQSVALTVKENLKVISKGNHNSVLHTTSSWSVQKSGENDGDGKLSHLFFTSKIHIFTIIEKLGDAWSSDIIKEKGNKLIILEEKSWLVRLWNRIGTCWCLLTFPNSWRWTTWFKTLQLIFKISVLMVFEMVSTISEI